MSCRKQRPLRRLRRGGVAEPGRRLRLRIPAHPLGIGAERVARHDRRRIGAASPAPDITPVHDPVIIRAGDRWHIFSTGFGEGPHGLIAA
ncbi:hypothetical protein OKW76_05855 [Sphingomonas sp. S1-29]|uniref:hypothetical protein n=1 Tax=Sphingomonas sp. S1-29 TaxID=2991074 RepID=UPI00223F8C01|nr:hypothetical protein [Sphingomonas sp. S1-29]UZK71173.1 hypothetical protein OKW76_05855 [Sphingomonas sp. S1-29]